MYNYLIVFSFIIFLCPHAIIHVRASRQEELRACGVILRDLPQNLASSFCSSFARIEDITSTFTSTIEQSTIEDETGGECTNTAFQTSIESAVQISVSDQRPPVSSEPTPTAASDMPEKSSTKYLEVSSQSSQIESAVVIFFTTTVTFTSTVTIPPSWPTQYLGKHIARAPAAFCPEVGMPCIMAGMEPDVISEGCREFAEPNIAQIVTEFVSIFEPSPTSLSCDSL